MEAELGEKDADGRSERPPYAPERKWRRPNLRTPQVPLLAAWAPASSPLAVHLCAQPPHTSGGLTLIDFYDGSDSHCLHC